jgi:hypothetical protein
MQGLQEYTKACLYEQEEWEGDKQAEIRKDHWIEYPKRNYHATPHSWSAPGNENGYPDVIEQSHPLYPALKRRHYKNHHAKRYPNPRSRSRSPDPKPVQRQLYKNHNSTLHTPSPPTMLDNKHHNNPPAPTAYSTSCSRPPPWPNRNPVRNHHNKPHYNTHTPAGTTTKRQPPPWPIIPSSTTVLSIGDSHPPALAKHTPPSTQTAFPCLPYTSLMSATLAHHTPPHPLNFAKPPKCQAENQGSVTEYFGQNLFLKSDPHTYSHLH